MSGTGFLSGLVAKLAGLGSAAKVGVATATAALTLTVAAAAAAVLPLGSSDSGPGIEGALGQAAAVTATEPATTPTTGDVAVQANAAASVTPPASSSTAEVEAGETAEAVESPIPPLPIPGTDVVDLSALAGIPTQVMGCLSPVLDLVHALPAVPSMDQITQIGPEMVGCVSGIVASLPLPMGLNACISEIMGLVTDMTSHFPTGMPNIGGFNVAACIPSGLPVPAGIPGLGSFMGGGFPFGG